ncbi:acyltransferase family protein [Mucilaginibacter sp. AW1-3]
MVKKDQYFYSLDSLRGISAIAILLFHFNLLFFKALWIGVPVFFALSGFLITRILVTNKIGQNYFKPFYYKRALRIFPIYYILFFVSLLWGCLIHVSASQWWIYLFYLQNFSISLNMRPIFGNGLMQHTWSLSVEELFYLIWPLFIRLANTARVLFTAIVLYFVIIAGKIVLISLYPTASSENMLLLSFFGNLDSLMGGVIIGILSIEHEAAMITAAKKYFGYALAILGTVIILNYFSTGANTMILEVVLGCAVSLFSPLCIIYFAYIPLSKVVRQIFDNQFLRFTGKISYGIYLYHYAVYLLADALVYHFKLTLNIYFIVLIKLAVTFAIAIISWNLIESKLLKLKNRFNYNV